jgi:predicted ATPase with chaperone activity
VQSTRNIQQARFTNPNSKTSDIISNADRRIGGDQAILPVAGRRRRTERVEVSQLDALGDIVLCMTQLNLSARAYHRILKLACPVTDLAALTVCFAKAP